MSNRTIAIIASVMAAVSFARDAVHVTLSVERSDRECVCRIDRDPREATIAVSSEGLHIRTTAGGHAVDVLVAVGNPFA